MKIKNILSQNRRDFTAIYICEHCEKTEKSFGYDDYNFHQNVIPKMICKYCGKTSPEYYQAKEPKYPAEYQI
jgi:primosomal protein N'